MITCLPQVVMAVGVAMRLKVCCIIDIVPLTTIQLVTYVIVIGKSTQVIYSIYLEYQAWPVTSSRVSSPAQKYTYSIMSELLHNIGLKLQHLLFMYHKVEYN